MGERHNEREEILFIAPENFSMVEDGVYRSAFPRSKNMAFLDKLGLRSVLSLSSIHLTIASNTIASRI